MRFVVLIVGISALLRAATALAVVVTASGSAWAADKSAIRCANAAEGGQVARDEGRLLEARAMFASCGEDACPAVIRRECLRWLEEIDQRLPTVVFSVKDADGKDVLDAEITIDGKRVAGASEGRETRVDPGPHRIAATRGGVTLADETVVVREREQGRIVSLTQAARPASSSPSTSLAPARPEAGRRPVPVLTWVLAGVAVAGGVGFGYFWSTGVDRVHDLRATCAPRCADGDVENAALMLNAGRLSLGIGIAAAVSAVAVYVLRPTVPANVTASGSGLRLQF